MGLLIFISIIVVLTIARNLEKTEKIAIGDFKERREEND